VGLRGILGGEPPVYDHYSIQLAFAYVNAITARGLAALLEMTERPPVVDVSARTSSWRSPRVRGR